MPAPPAAISGLSQESTRADFDYLLRTGLSDDLESFGKKILAFFSGVSQAYRGVFFVWNSEKQVLEARNSYACRLDELSKKQYALEEGLIGQAAALKKTFYFDELLFKGNTAPMPGVQTHIRALLVLPLFFKQTAYGVIELTFLKKCPPALLAYLESLAGDAAATLESIVNTDHNLRLLKKIEEQKGTLQVQEAELRQNLEELTSIQDLLQKQNKQIEDAFARFKENHHRLMQSIQYAKKMQETILPDNDKFLRIFQDFFVIYQPKDIVSGDFYWYGRRGNYYFVAVIDCTGHGVPGALMSMTGNAMLNQIVLERKTTETDQILTSLHERVIKTLKQKAGNNSDGMNLLICRFEFMADKSIELQFSGAKSDLYHLRKGVLQSLIGDRLSIGGVNEFNQALFTKQSINLQKDDFLYLITDGILDICDAKRKKFGKKNWEIAMQTQYPFACAKQKENIVKIMEDYQQQEAQRDDITVLGIRI